MRLGRLKFAEREIVYLLWDMSRSDVCMPLLRSQSLTKDLLDMKSTLYMHVN